jgi:hypothetical protein
MNWTNNESKNKSKFRRIVHGSYHFVVAIGKRLFGNKKGSSA